MKKALSLLGLAFTALMSVYGQATTNYTSADAYEVASLIVNLSRSITRDLNPPATGAERIVTKALVSEEGNSRIYHIEGKDVYHTGRVLSTYWLRLTKPLAANGAMHVTVETVASEPARGRTVSEESYRLIGPLLNSLYDIALLNLEHRNVVIEQISETSDNPFTLELVGLNDICTHDELNRFRLTLTRHSERNRSWYETVLEHPYGWSDVPPTYPDLPIPGTPLPFPPSAPLVPVP